MDSASSWSWVTSRPVAPVACKHRAHVLADLRAERRVECREGLVEEHDLRSRRQRTCQCHARLLTPGELVGAATPVTRQPHELEQLVHPCRAALSRDAETDVAGDVQMGEEGSLLRDQSDAATLGSHRRDAAAGNLPVAEPNPPGIRPLEAGNHPQQGGLAASGRTEDGSERPVGHRDVDVIESGDRTEALGHPTQYDVGHSPSSTASGSDALANKNAGTAAMRIRATAKGAAAE